MLKAAEVELILARTICSGKYVVIVGGEVAAVRSSVDSGMGIWESAIIDSGKCRECRACEFVCPVKAIESEISVGE